VALCYFHKKIRTFQDSVSASSSDLVFDHGQDMAGVACGIAECSPPKEEVKSILEAGKALWIEPSRFAVESQ
jgi:hypothetical protein